MAKIAIDVALLLPETISKICVNLNQRDGSEWYSDLSKPDNYPHITLAMGVIDEADIEQVDKRLGEIARQYTTLSLEINRLSHNLTPGNKIACGFDITLTDKIQELHNSIMKELNPFISYVADQSMFRVDDDEIFDPISIFWVENFRNVFLGTKLFNPHISLKCRKAEYDSLPISFPASQITLCRMGNHWTCRDILHSYMLK